MHLSCQQPIKTHLQLLIVFHCSTDTHREQPQHHNQPMASNVPREPFKTLWLEKDLTSCFLFDGWLETPGWFSHSTSSVCGSASTAPHITFATVAPPYPSRSITRLCVPACFTLPQRPLHVSPLSLTLFYTPSHPSINHSSVHHPFIAPTTNPSSLHPSITL